MQNTLNGKIIKTLEKMFELFLNLFCLIGLIYQSYILLNEYISGKTVVSIRVGRLKTETLPALTVCFQVFYDVKKMVNGRDDFAGKYSKYKNLVADHKRKGNNAPDPAILGKMRQIYLSIINEMDPMLYTAQELLSNYSFHYDL